MIERDRSHPCIVAWVPFNESWGVPDLPDSPTQRHYVQALYHLTKTLDPTRPVVGNDGWESVATDVIGIHDYDDQLAGSPAGTGPRRRSAAVPAGAAGRPDADPRRRPAGAAGPPGRADRVRRDRVLPGGGDVGLQPGRHRPRRSPTGTPTCWLVVRSLPVLAGFCYTQFADTYQEANGLLFADRTPKFPLADIARATRGPATAREFEDERAWREELMRRQRQPRDES